MIRRRLALPGSYIRGGHEISREYSLRRKASQCGGLSMVEHVEEEKQAEEEGQVVVLREAMNASVVAVYCFHHSYHRVSLKDGRRGHRR